jgi:hypothetical protein
MRRGQRYKNLVNKMPRDKKIIHRATSDVEDSDIDETSIEDIEDSSNSPDKKQQPLKQDELNKLIEERKKFLKDIILKRNLALKQQREKDKQQKVNSTKQ